MKGRRGGEGIIIINMPRLFSYWSICIVFTAYLHTRYWIIYLSIHHQSRTLVHLSIFSGGRKMISLEQLKLVKLIKIFAFLVFTPLSFNLIQDTVIYCSYTLSFLQNNEFLFLQKILKGQGQKPSWIGVMKLSCWYNRD